MKTSQVILALVVVQTIGLYTASTVVCQSKEIIMKASRLTVTLFIAGLFLFNAQMVFCQSEKVDIIEYTPPKGWTKTPKDGLMVFSDTER